jgi:RNAse (barnase) inhibitor barstar
MNVPDLSELDNAGVHAWHGDTQPLAAAAAGAKLAFRTVDLKNAASKADLMAALQKGLELPDHFGGNFDALADCLEDAEWAGRGNVIVVRHTAPFRKAHAADWATLDDIFAEAAEYWQERHKPFFVFVE